MCVCVQTNVTLGNSSSVVACLSPRAPVLQLNHSQSCGTGSKNNIISHVRSMDICNYLQLLK